MDEQRAVSIFQSIENDSIMLQNLTNSAVGIATTEIIHDGGNAELILSADSSLAKAAYNSNGSNNNCVQMGSAGAAVSSTYGPAAASAVSELTSINLHSAMDNQMMHGHNTRKLAGNENQINNLNGSIKSNTSDSCVQSETSKIPFTTSFPKQPFAMCRGQGWPLISSDNARDSINGSASSGGVTGSNGVINNAGIIDNSSKLNTDISAKLTNNFAGTLSSSDNNGAGMSIGSSKCSINGNANGSGNTNARVTTSSLNGSSNAVKANVNSVGIMYSSTSGSYNCASTTNGNNNAAATVCMNSSTVNAGRKRSRSAPWTVAEMLALIDAKRNERQKSMSYKTRGLKLPGAEKWKLVSRYLESKEMERSGSQCQDKWENMMKDYKAVRDWQTQHGNSANTDKDGSIEGNRGRNYFKHMTNKERKEARLPPQMDEIIFSSLHAIQHEKEEQRRVSSIGSSSLLKPKSTLPLASSSASLITDYHQFYHQPQNHHNFPLDIAHGSQLNLNIHPFATPSADHSTVLHAPATTNSNKNVQQKTDLDSRLINTHKDEITSTTQILQENTQENKASCNRLPSSPLQLAQHVQDGSQAEHIKETATLVQVLVALADAVKTVAQKL